jgi:hypothetical protein
MKKSHVRTGLSWCQLPRNFAGAYLVTYRDREQEDHIPFGRRALQCAGQTPIQPEGRSTVRHVESGVIFLATACITQLERGHLRKTASIQVSVFLVAKEQYSREAGEVSQIPW